MLGLKIYCGSASQEPTVWGQPLRHKFSGTIRYKNPERVRSENIGSLIFLTFPNLRKSLMKYHHVFFSIRSKDKIKIQSKPSFVELAFGITLFGNIGKKCRNSHEHERKRWKGEVLVFRENDVCLHGDLSKKDNND